MNLPPNSNLGPTPDFFLNHVLTPRKVVEVNAYLIEEANVSGFVTLLLAVVHMDNGLFMIVRAGKTTGPKATGWTSFNKRPSDDIFESLSEAIDHLKPGEKSALRMKATASAFKCSWCELVFKEGVDTHHPLMVRISNKLSIDETLCDDCIRYVYEKIQPIMEGRIQRQAPRKGRNIIL